MVGRAISQGYKNSETVQIVNPTLAEVSNDSQSLCHVSPQSHMSSASPTAPQEAMVVARGML